jgi:predicted dinucleotide-binding enzyme
MIGNFFQIITGIFGSGVLGQVAKDLPTIQADINIAITKSEKALALQKTALQAQTIAFDAEMDALASWKLVNTRIQPITTDLKNV